MGEEIKIVFIGSRGIPAKYGGNETFVEEIANRIKEKGFDVFVTCESNKYLLDEYRGVKRIHIKSVKSRTTIPTINDLLAVVYLILRFPDIQIYYFVAPDGSIAALLPRLLGKKIIINTDGLEWKRVLIRKKYYPLWLKPIAYLVYKYLLFTEYISNKISDTVIADSKVIEDYLINKYKTKKVEHISYGSRKLYCSSISEEEEKLILKKFNLEPHSYYLTVGRIVAENNIHIEVRGFIQSLTKKKLIIVGNFNSSDPYVQFLYKIKGDDNRVIFHDPIYEQQTLGILRKNCFAYIHAYEVGGTNPSLLEQMTFQRPILAYDVPFHWEVLGKGGIYFRDDLDLVEKIRILEEERIDLEEIKKCLEERLEDYNWDDITNKYVTLFLNTMKKNGNDRL